MPPVEIVQSIPLPLRNDAETRPYPVQGTVAVGNWPQFRVSYRHLNGKYVRDRLLQCQCRRWGSTGLVQIRLLMPITTCIE